MKKIWLILLFLLLAGILLGTEEKNKDYTTRVFGTVDIDGALSNNESFESNKTFGLQLFAEKFHRYNKDFEMSYGAGLQINQNSSNIRGEAFTSYSAPIYAALKYNIFGEALYIKGKLGLPLKSSLEVVSNLAAENGGTKLNIKEKTPIFWGLSVGLDYGIYEWEMAYTINSVDYSYLGNTGESSDKLENIRVSIGYSKKIY